MVALLNVFFPVVAIAATRSAFQDEKMRSQSMGFICAGLNIVMYGSPLSAMVSSFVTLTYLSKTLYIILSIAVLYYPRFEIKNVAFI